MKVDFSPYTHVLDDGTIWWPLGDAVKLGAGFLPFRDDDRVLVPTLTAENNRVRAAERDLLSQFIPSRLTEAHPRIRERDGQRFVEAGEYLHWLLRHVQALQSDDFAFPTEVASAVRRAKSAARSGAKRQAEFVLLTSELKGWFDRPFADLPVELKERVKRDIFVAPWDDLAVSQRRNAAAQADYFNDPSNDAEQNAWFVLFGRKAEIERAIRDLTNMKPANPMELAEKERNLLAKNAELAVMNRQIHSDEVRRQRYAVPGEDLATKKPKPTRYLPYTRVARTLAERLGATPEEIAAWVFMGSDANGLSAYLNANELDSPPRFSFEDLMLGSRRDLDYVGPLMACWFDEAEIDKFEGKDRYITGEVLCSRWADRCGGRPEAFIRARVPGSDLLDLHPITIETQATHPNDDAYPPLSSGLFLVSAILEVEAIFFPSDASKSIADAESAPVDTPTASALQIRINFPVHRDPEANERWWKTATRECRKNGLVGCRIGGGKRGQSGGSLWQPVLVAGWLLDRKVGARGTLTSRGVQAGLRKFAGCEDAADDLPLAEE